MKAVITYLEEGLKRHVATTDLSRSSGCTCTLLYLKDNHYSIANLGDTQYVFHMPH